MLKRGEIILKNGELVQYYAEFNKGYSHIIIDDGCWVIVNGEDGTAAIYAWIYPEAMENLKLLPNNPKDYKQEKENE